jgi:hypothetical protein
MKKIKLIIMISFFGFVSTNYFAIGSVNSNAQNEIKETISIDFQGGFQNDTISIEVNGIEVFTKEITTNQVQGLAYCYEIKICDDDQLTIFLFKNNTKYQVVIKDFSSPYIGVWFNEETGLVCYFNEKPFKYE